MRHDSSKFLQTFPSFIFHFKRSQRYMYIYVHMKHRCKYIPLPSLSFHLSFFFSLSIYLYLLHEVFFPSLFPIRYFSKNSSEYTWRSCQQVIINDYTIVRLNSLDRIHLSSTVSSFALRFALLRVQEVSSTCSYCYQCLLVSRLREAIR